MFYSKGMRSNHEKIAIVGLNFGEKMLTETEFIE